MKRMLSLLALLCVMVPLFAYNPDFELKYQQAKTLYDQGQFEKARSIIQRALQNLPDLSPEQKDDGNELITLCNQAIGIRDRLELASSKLSVSFRQGRDSVRVTAGQPKLLTASSANPAWCKVDRIAGGWLYLDWDANPAKSKRETQVVVRMGKVKKQTLRVIQEARPETVKRVTIQSVPDHAYISVDGDAPNTGSWHGILSSGLHRLHLEKDGYAVKDTLITIPDDFQSEEHLQVIIPLQPQFAIIQLDVRPEEGFAFAPSSLSVIMNTAPVSSDPRELYSYDDDRDLQRYSLYQDGTVPVYPGWVDIEVSAAGFETWKSRVYASVGERLTVPATLKAITGSIRLIDNGKAKDATVFLDGEKIGLVNELTARRTMVGEHVITLEYEGLIPGEDTYPVTVRENEDTPVLVSMDRYNSLLVTSSPVGAQVKVDGEDIGFTPTKPYSVREREAGHSYVIEVSKDFHQTYRREIHPDFSSANLLQEDFTLVETHKFQITADEPKLRLTIKNARNGDSTFVSNVILPAEIELPFRNKPYYLELNRLGEKRSAYRGRLDFREGTHPQRRIRTWSRDAFQFLTAELVLAGRGDFQLGNTPEQKAYFKLGNVCFSKFRLFDGFSSSVARGGFFLGTDAAAPLQVRQEGKERVFDVNTAQFLPAISLLFINADFRVGGGILDFLDVNALLSYVWYPDIWSHFMGFSYMSGHDFFVGAELGSRFPYVNLYLKAGVQFYKDLQANIYINEMNNPVDECFFKTPLEMPAQFVFSIGFSLGGKDSKGHNILRVF